MVRAAVLRIVRAGFGQGTDLRAALGCVGGDVTILAGGGETLYKLFGKTSTGTLPAWEHLTNEERAHWQRTADAVDEHFDAGGSEDN